MIVCIGCSRSGLVRREHRLGAEDAEKGPLKMLQSRIPIYVRAIIFWVLFVVIVALFWIQVGFTGAALAAMLGLAFGFGGLIAVVYKRSGKK